MEAKADSRLSVYHSVRSREVGLRIAPRSIIPTATATLINAEYDKVLTVIQDLNKAVTSRSFNDLESAFADVINLTMMDHASPSRPKNYRKKQMRQLFVQFGGIEAILKALEPPFAPEDARTIAPARMKIQYETWNEVFVVLRELLLNNSTLPERYFDNQHIIFLFTMLHFPSTFENAINLLEEILALQEHTFSLASIPRFYSLVRGFHSRHLAHFCRILSLVVFEPEDRHIMEGSHVLRSLDLLHLRRSRMARGVSCNVDKNQNLIIQLPELFPRLIQILRIMNYGPNLQQLVQNNIITQMPISTDILTFNSVGSGVSDWDHFASLESLLESKTEQAQQSTQTVQNTTQNIAQNTQTAQNNADNIVSLEDMLIAFRPSHGRQLELANIINVMLLAERMNIAEVTVLGQSLLFSTPNAQQTRVTFLQHRMRNTTLLGMQNGVNNRTYDQQYYQQLSVQRCQMELQFHAMLLIPHQIELIFVLCTLLSGRRKLYVQEELSKNNLISTLNIMFDRMSWLTPPNTPSSSVNPNSGIVNESDEGQHVHGPNCECNNPESAIRIQFLRLLHNFYDRDFIGNPNKFACLSVAERGYVRGSFSDTSDDLSLAKLDFLSLPPGLISRMTETLLNLPEKSTYRFWMSACIENFARGCGCRGQELLVQRGVFTHVIHSLLLTINSDNTKEKEEERAGNYQTSFDLLGELIKGNIHLLTHLEQTLSTEEIQRFLTMCIDHLVDSNVFLRSLFVTLELVHTSSMLPQPQEDDVCSQFGFLPNSLFPTSKAQQEECSSHQRNSALEGYLNATWIQEIPSISNKALGMYANHTVSSSKKVMNKSGMKISKTTRQTPASNSAVGRMNRDFNTEDSTGSGGSGSSIWSVSEALVIPQPPPPQPQVQQQVQQNRLFPFFLTPPVFNDLIEEKERDTDMAAYFTPPEGPKYSRVWNNNTTAVTDKVKELPKQEAKVAKAFVVPPSLFQFSAFMLTQKTAILIRLMSMVTIASINHENICCLNTTIMILLLDYHRGILAETLQSIRTSADDHYTRSQAGEDASGKEEDKGGVGECCEQCTQPAATSSLFCLSCTISHFDTVADSTTQPTSKQSGQSPTKQSKAKSTKQDTSALLKSLQHRAKTQSTRQQPAEELISGGGDMVMHNFRELLWYWQEYYLRRGRDRLSIEFSSHIPFRFWYEVVVVLCADDGSPTALLGSPPEKLPKSPYQMSNNSWLTQGRGPEVGSVVLL